MISRCVRHGIANMLLFHVSNGAGVSIDGDLCDPLPFLGSRCQPDKNVVRCLRDAAHLHGRIIICYVGVTGSVNHLGVLVLVLCDRFSIGIQHLK
jgi:hypothetical protein